MWNDHLLKLRRRDLDRTILYSDVIVCISDYLAKGILRRAPHADGKVYVMQCGVDLDHFSHSDAKCRESGNKHVVFVGRLTEDKGPHLLLAAMRRVIKRIPEAKLVVVGSSWFGTDHQTPFVKQLKQSSQGIEDRICFTGFVPHYRVQEVLSRADIFVSPSVWQEPYGQMNVEAMAMGVPVITSPRGGIPEIIGDAGVMVDPEDTNALADAIIQMLEDPLLAAAFGRKGRERVERHFDWNIRARDFRLLFERLLHNE